MESHPTPKFSVFGAVAKEVPSTHVEKTKKLNKVAFITESSCGNAADVVERMPEIALLYHQHDMPVDHAMLTMTDSQHSIPFLGDLEDDESGCVEETNDVLKQQQEEDPHLQRLLALWTNPSLKSLPMLNDNAILDKDETFWRDFLKALNPTEIAVPGICLNALYQLEHRVPDAYGTWWKEYCESNQKTIMAASPQGLEGNEKVVVVAQKEEGTVDESKVEEKPVVEEPKTEETNTATEEVVPVVADTEKAAMNEPNKLADEVSVDTEKVLETKEPSTNDTLTREPLSETSNHAVEPSNQNARATETVLAEQWMDATLCSLPIQNISHLDMGVFLDALSPSRLSIVSVHAMNAMYRLDQIEPERYAKLLRHLEHHSTMTTSSNGGVNHCKSRSSASESEVASNARADIDLDASAARQENDNNENAHVSPLVEQQQKSDIVESKEDDDTPVVVEAERSSIVESEEAVNRTPVEAVNAQETKQLDLIANVKEEESSNDKPEPPTESSNHAAEISLAEQWMDATLCSLPIQNACNLDMGVFLDALSPSRLSTASLNSMNAMYRLDQIEPERYSKLFSQIEDQSTMTSGGVVDSKLRDPTSADETTKDATSRTETAKSVCGEDELDPNTSEQTNLNDGDSNAATTVDKVPSDDDLEDASNKTNETGERIEAPPTETSISSEAAPEKIGSANLKAKETATHDAASFATSETAMTSLLDLRGADDGIPASSTSSLKSTDSSVVDVVPLKVAGNPTMTAPSYSEVIRKAAEDNAPFQETSTTTTRKTTPVVKRSQPKTKFVPSLSAVVSVDDSSQPTATPKDQTEFDNADIVLLMTTSPAHPEVARQQKIVAKTLKEENCDNCMIVDGADRANKWKRNFLFGLSGSHGEYPQIFNRDSEGKLSFWGTFETFSTAKKRGSILSQLLNVHLPIQDEQKVEKRLLVLISGQSLKQDVKVKQTKALSILDAHGISYETLDGADPVNKDRRSELFALSGLPGQYPQFFVVGSDQGISHWGDWDDFEASNELGSLAKEFIAADTAHTSNQGETNTTASPTIDGSIVCLISGQSIERNVRNQQEKSFAIFNDKSIPYECIDGAEKSNKTLRNKLFAISGLRAVYPQFFLKKDDDFFFLGGWNKLEECNDANNLTEFLVPEEPMAPNDAEVTTCKSQDALDPGNKSTTEPSAVKRTLSTQPTPKMDNRSQDAVSADATLKSAKSTQGVKASKSEITFYGATSFVAKHALDYMIQVSLTLPGVRKITLAGRNLAKLEGLLKTVTEKMSNMRTLHSEALGHCTFDVFVADSSDLGELEAMALRTKVVACFAGPFAKYSEKVVGACAKVGTDYVDITGEVFWASAMRLKYSPQAEASGARIVSFCGFDSVPSDLAIYAAAENMKRKLGRSTVIASGTTWHHALGSANGGTIQTVVEMPINIRHCFFRSVPFLVDDPLALTHPRIRLDAENNVKKQRLSTVEWKNQLLAFESFLGWGVSAPFFMAPINAKVVQASAVALDYGPDFIYRERYLPLGFRMTKAMSVLSFIPAFFVQLGVLLVAFVLKFPIFGKIVAGILFPPGSGMSDQMCRQGVSEVYAEVVSAEKDGKVDRVYCAMKFEGDPGNWVTAQCVCESALALVLDRSKLPKRSADGFGTPAELLGSVLLERLEKTKVRPVDVKTYVHKSAAPNDRVLCHFQ